MKRKPIFHFANLLKINIPYIRIPERFLSLEGHWPYELIITIFK